MIQRIGKSFRQIYRFSTTEPKVAPQGSILKEEEKQYQVPIHLRPYDAAKYEVLSDKIKINTGYALMEVEPFPRARIMRISYNILQRLRDIPEKAVYRRLTEERIKHIMKLTDEVEDISELEKALGMETLQFFISQLVQEFEQIEVAKQIKPWVKTEHDKPAFIPHYTEPASDPRYIRPPRFETQFLKEQ